MPILLTVIGLFFIFEASSVTAFRQLGDSFYFLRQQLVWCTLGICAMTFFSFFDYKRLYYFAFPLLLLTLFFLVIVLIPGIGSTVYGARRWINFGFFSFQPTELAKIAVILYLSSWFLYKERKRFLHFILILGSIIGLTIDVYKRQLYTCGAGEFFYTNSLDFRGLIDFPVSESETHPITSEYESSKALILHGGCLLYTSRCV